MYNFLAAFYRREALVFNRKFTAGTLGAIGLQHKSENVLENEGANSHFSSTTYGFDIERGCSCPQSARLLHFPFIQSLSLGRRAPPCASSLSSRTHRSTGDESNRQSPLRSYQLLRTASKSHSGEPDLILHSTAFDFLRAAFGRDLVNIRHCSLRTAQKQSKTEIDRSV